VSALQETDMSTHRRSRIAVAITTTVVLTGLSLTQAAPRAAAPSGAVQACWDFSTLQQTDPYRLGQIFVAPTATIEMTRYLLNGNLTANTAGLGWARPSQIAGGPAPEFRLYLLNAHVVPNAPVNTVSFNFGHQLGLGGGQANIGVNGELVEVTTSLADLDGRVLGNPAIGTAEVSVVLNGPVGQSPEQGTLTLQALSGQIEKFTIGGVQLYIDHVCMQ
jgi:hypothetical protein